MSRQICATAEQIEAALEDSGISTAEFLERLTKVKASGIPPKLKRKWIKEAKEA